MNRSRILKACSGRNCNRRGATVVEFAFGFMLFVTILLTLTEIGRGMWTYAKINHAARQAGRYCMVRGSVNPTNTTEVRAIVDRQCNGLELSDVTLTTRWNPNDATPKTDPALVERGDIVEIKVTYPFKLITGGLILSDNSVQMGATTRMVVAN